MFVGKDQAVFVIDKSRKRKVALSILEEFDGIVVSDSFGAWNCIGGMQQKCLLHYFRDMYRTKEKNTSPEFSRFFSTLYHILKDAIGRKKGHNNRNSKKECVRRIEKLKARVRRLVDKKYDCKDCKRYVKRLKREIDSLFTFILYDVHSIRIKDPDKFSKKLLPIAGKIDIVCIIRTHALRSNLYTNILAVIQLYLTPFFNII